MDHDCARLELADLVTGRLPAEKAVAVQAHVSECDECRGLVETLRGVERAFAFHGEALLGEHPPAADIERYAVRDRDLPSVAAAAIAAHVRSCDSCRYEVTVTRRVHRETESWWGRLLAFLSEPLSGNPRMVLVPAAAILLLALVYPAYLGLVRLPQMTRQVGAGQEWHGGVRFLTLAAPRRSGQEPTGEVRLRPGQPFLPVLVEADLDQTPPRPDRIVRVVLRAGDNGAVHWQTDLPAGEIWDPDLGSVSLLLPATSLVPDTYSLTLTWAGGEENPFYFNRFRVREASAP